MNKLYIVNKVSLIHTKQDYGFPGRLAGKESSGNVGDLGSTLRLGISPGGR